MAVLLRVNIFYRTRNSFSVYKQCMLVTLYMDMYYVHVCTCNSMIEVCMCTCTLSLCYTIFISKSCHGRCIMYMYNAQCTSSGTI